MLPARGSDRPRFWRRADASAAMDLRNAVDRMGERRSGPNALLIAGVAFTFTLMAFARSGFLLLLEGLTARQWYGLVRLLFERA
jgi:hypothetical protein